MASGPITSWQIDGKTMETVTDFILGGSKITADSNWSHEIRRRLVLARKAMTNLDSILKSRDITLLTKVHLIKAVVFPVVVYGCKSWTTKKAERWRIDAFLLWCWRRLLRIPWTARRSKQSTLRKSALNIHCKDWCWSWSASSTLATWCEELEKTLMLGKIEGRRRRGQQTEDEMVGWHHWLDGHSLSKIQEMVKDREAWSAAVHGVSKSWTQLRDWTTRKDSPF